MDTSKKSIQELILDMLAGRSAVKQKRLGKNIEHIIEDSEYCERKVKPKYIINRTIKKMIEDDMIAEHNTGFSSFLSLTKRGRHKLRNIKLSAQSHLVSTDWDGYWRIVVIDVPETRKSERDALRYILKKAQFVQIKNSLWISPFPMEHMMINMKDDLDLHEELMVFVTDTLDPGTEQMLKQKFMENKKESI